MYACIDIGGTAIKVAVSDKLGNLKSKSKLKVKDNFEELEGKEVKVAGRLMSKRGQGKVVFADLADLPGKIQLFIKIDNVGEEALKEFKTFDLGDWVAATGEVFKTKIG